MTEIFCEKNSFYFNVREDRPIEMSLEEFVKSIQSLRWKTQVEEYHRLLTEGEEKKAKELKNKMPGMIIAGKSQGTHALEHMCGLSGDSMYDLDHCGGNISLMMEKLKQLPWVKAAWRSISQEGLKVVVRVEARTVEEYAHAYAIVAYHIRQELNFPCDMQCKNLSRPCFASYDPEAFYRPATIVFPWRKFAEEHPEQMKQILDEMGVVAAPLQGMLENTISAPGFLQNLLDEFLVRHSFVKGNRNACLLQLGRVARYKGLSPDELKGLVGLAVDYLPDEEYLPEDIAKKITAGYGFADTHAKPAPAGFKVQGSPMGDEPSADASKLADNEEGIGEKLRRAAPRFPNELYKRLPDFLLRGLRMARTPLERDMLLMGMLANLSACLPKVRILYAGRHYSPHFYFLDIAPTGTGKGVLTLAAMLPKGIQNHFAKENAKLVRKYKSDQAQWEIEMKIAAQAKRLPDFDKEPEPPHKRYLIISPNVSKSQLIISLEDSGDVGLIMNASELDMLTAALHQECGKHDEVFRAGFQHEEVSSAYKADGRQIWAFEPHFALCASGTPAQLLAFVHSQENGLWSRLALLTGRGEIEWHSAAPDAEAIDACEYFKELSGEVLAMFLFLQDRPTEVVFTDEQWKKHSECFSSLLTGVVEEGDDTPAAIVYRHGLIQARIASILTALRKCEAQWNTSEYKCTDEDFDTAMEITRVLLAHSLLLSTSLHGLEERARPNPLRSFYRKEGILEAMNDEFTFTEFVNLAMKKGASKSTSQRWLTKFLEAKLIEKQGVMYVKNKNLQGSCS